MKQGKCKNCGHRCYGTYCSKCAKAVGVVKERSKKICRLCLRTTYKDNCPDCGAITEFVK